MCRSSCQLGLCCLRTNRICCIWFLFIYISTFIGILPFFCQKLKHPGFYLNEGNEDDLLNQVQAENDRRALVAREYLSQVNLTGISALNHQEKGNRNSLSVVLIGVARNRKHENNNYQPLYLTQVVAELLRQRELLNVHIPILLCNVDPQPDDFDEIRTLNFLPIRTKYVSSESFPNILEKEKEDYVFCLNATRNAFHSQFVLAIEDDAFPTDNFVRVLYEKVLHMATYKYNSVTDEYIPRRNIGFVKLYHPERLMHFLSSDPTRLCEFFAISIAFAILLSCAHALVAKRRAWSCYNEAYPIFLTYFFFAALVLVMIGRPAFLEFRRYFLPDYVYMRPTPSCCTPAVLFPVENLDKVLGHLHETFSERNRGKDTLLDEAMVKYRLSAKLVEPNMVTHIGMYTTLRERRLSPRLIV